MLLVVSRGLARIAYVLNRPCLFCIHAVIAVLCAPTTGGLAQRFNMGPLTGRRLRSRGDAARLGRAGSATPAGYLERHSSPWSVARSRSGADTRTSWPSGCLAVIEVKLARRAQDLGYRTTMVICMPFLARRIRAVASSEATQPGVHRGRPDRWLLGVASGARVRLRGDCRLDVGPRSRTPVAGASASAC
jgi:hypothetical protein